MTAAIDTNRPRILVLDDDPTDVEDLRRILASRGYSVDAALDAGRGLELLARTPFDLLLLEPHLAGIDDAALLESMGRHAAPPALIMLSRHAAINDASRALRQGAREFLRKPAAPETLLHATARVLEQRRLETDNRRMQIEQAESEQLHRFVLDHSPDIIAMTDAGGRINYVNDRARALLGYTTEELLSSPFADLVHPRDRYRVRHLLEAVEHDDAPASLELRLLPRDPEAPERDFSLAVHSLVDEGPTPGLYIVARDITAQRRAEALADYHRQHDLLTDLPNRTLFRDRLEQALAHAQHHRLHLGVLLVNLDRFQLVNDSLGYLFGDELLQAVARRIREALGPEDTVARTGGDEFAILLPEVDSAAAMDAVARRLLETTEIPFSIGDREITMGMSIGGSLHPVHGETGDRLLKHADMATHAVKCQGRHQYALFDAGMQRRFTGSLTLENELRRAVASGDGFRLCYQPQVRLTGPDDVTAELAGMEVLLRWESPGLGNVPPGHFISTAEETGLIAPLGHWVLESALIDIAAWRAAGYRVPCVSVNASVLQLAQPRFADTLIELLERHELPGECLELEITENTLMTDMDANARILRRLAEHGVRIAIDDFGKGYSSLSYLHSLPLDTLKIDQQFVANLHEGQSRTIVDAIIAMANGLDLDLIAEGVETREQLDYLLRRGCQNIQGFLFSRPRERDRITELLGGDRRLGPATE